MRSAVVLFAGVVMLLSSGAHGLLGWPAMRTALERAGADPALVGALAAGWWWGTASMVAFGAITLLCGLRLRRGDRSAVAILRWIAAGYLAFGVTAFFIRDLNPHFLLFVVTGLLAGAPTLGLRDVGR